MKRLGRWAFGVAVALDILLGAVVFGTRPGETISHAANRNPGGWGGPVCAALDVIDPGHCAKVTY